MAAETSTLTIISVPGLAYERDFRFLQLVIGYLIGRVIISVIPDSAILSRRAGHSLSIDRAPLRTAAAFADAGLFLITRAAAEGVRVFAVAIVVGIALGNLLGGFSDFGRDVAAIAIVSLLTLIYTFEGGMAAVIWTDVVQLAVYIVPALWPDYSPFCILFPAAGTPCTASPPQAGKFRVFDFSWNFYATYTFWSGVIGGAFLTTASHGTDQLIVQRLLSARSERQSKLALAGQRRHGLVPVFVVPADRRHALCLLQIVSSRCRVHPRGHDFPDLCRHPHAARNQRPVDLGNPGCGHGEPECGAQLAILHHHG